MICYFRRCKKQDMTFFQRLKRYLGGVVLGVLLSILLFQDKSSLLTSWLPGNRVKTELLEWPWQQGEMTDCLLNCVHTSEDALKTAIDEGDVLFDESQVRILPKVYVVETTLGKASFEMQDSLIILKSIADCYCPNTNQQ
jgi:hypothetical protein